MYLDKLAYLHIYIYLRKEDSDFFAYIVAGAMAAVSRNILPNTYFTKTMKYYALGNYDMWWYFVENNLIHL